MEKQSIFDKLKKFYQSKRGKSICFFGFYFIFFLILAVFLNNQKSTLVDKKNGDSKKVNQVMPLNNYYDISKIINSNYEYLFTVNDNEKITTYQGFKKQIDYNDFENKYFLDIYNINQLIKKSKFVKREENSLYYELSNNVLNDLLDTSSSDGVNTLIVYINDYNEVEKIVVDLKNYLVKEKYEITLEYKVGEV